MTVVSMRGSFRGLAVSPHCHCLAQHVPGRGSRLLPWRGLGLIHPLWLLWFLWASRVVWHGVAVPADGGRGAPPLRTATGLVQQPLPPLCRSSEVGMADPSLTFPVEHMSPPCSLTP